MLICALCVAPIVFASTTNCVSVAVGLIALAAAAHQGWSANMYTLASDMFPKKCVGSVVGIGSMFGALGGALLAYYAGEIRVQFGYMPLFALAGSAYLIALSIIHFIVPSLEPVENL
jgi:ACS family hexuronate transporter-like MFS transporter